MRCSRSDKNKEYFQKGNNTKVSKKLRRYISVNHDTWERVNYEIRDINTPTHWGSV